MSELADRRIVVTGATGQVGRPLAEALAATNEVIALGRFGDADQRARLEAAGVDCVVVDLASGDLSAAPGAADHVLNFSVAKSQRWDVDLAVNADAVGHLMSRYRDARSMLHCSTTAVYRPSATATAEGEPEFFDEQHGHGDHHRDLLPTYSISKVAGEAVARFAAVEFGLPTTIARLNVPYGDGGGWPAFHLLMLLGDIEIPVHPDGSRYQPIHDDDLVRDVPALLDLASVPATTINWSGDVVVSVEEWCRHLGALVGVEPRFVTNDTTIPSAVVDTARQREHLPPRAVDWRDGFRRMVAATNPHLLDGADS